MDSLGRRSGRQMARIRRQRSQEWREREFSSSENDDDGGEKYRYVDERVIQQYEKEVKAGLDVRTLPAPGMPMERGRSGHPAAGTVAVPPPPAPSTIQTVENRTYAPLSGSDGDTETDNPQSPIQMLIHQQSPHLNLPARGHQHQHHHNHHRMSLPLQRGPSTSSSDNNSDVTYPDSDMAMMRENGLAGRTDSADSPPEPAPPEVPPRGISMHHSDLASIRTPRDILAMTNTTRPVYTVGPPGSASMQSPAPGGMKDGHSDHGRSGVTTQDRMIASTALPATIAPLNTSTPVSGVHHHQPTSMTSVAGTVQNNAVVAAAHHVHPNTHHPTLLPAMMAVHPVRNNMMSNLPLSALQSEQHGLVSTSHVAPSPFSAANFQIRKSCSHRCSWKCIAIFLICVTVVLTAALAYFGGKKEAVSTMTLQLESSTGCILVEDSQLAAIEGVESSPAPTVKVPTLYPTRVAPNDHNLWPVMDFNFGQKISQEILPHGFWNIQIRQTQASFVRLNISLSAEADLAIYARRHQPPTITQFDFTEVIRRHSSGNKKARSTSVTAEVSFLHHLDPGTWFFSIYNDNSEQFSVSFIAEVAIGISTQCPQACHGHGACSLGKCECYQGYMGESCEHSLCPVLCSNHGTYSGGVCHCERGWKGTECSVPELDCEVADCSRHGECHAGVCICHLGFKGRHCKEVDCLDNLCAGHGECVRGKCICHPGWSGDNCSYVDNRLVKCLPNCSGHGTFDLGRGQCLCERYWTGPECNEAACSADCGPFGKCIGEDCQCVAGWTGSKCDHKLCDPRCSEHGQCNNGTCVCIQGWNGRHCTLEGCPRDCNHHGDCVTMEGEFVCVCHDGWDGIDCVVPLEKDCTDKIDNDNDGVIDCADSECCSHTACEESMMCLTTADPVDVLYRKQPPAVTASFYQRMKFLIEDNSVQSYVNKDEYSESRVSIIRGRVVNKLGQGLIGVRVSVYDDNKFGFTVSRDQGWFDIMVNGGGAVTLHFQRSPFEATKKKVMVPWNQIIVMDTEAMMVTSKDKLPLEPSSRHEECLEHDHSTMKPTVHETWRPGMLGGCSDRRVVYTETQVVQESVEIPGSDLHLLYQSSSSPGYHGTLYIQLTPENVPVTLTIVHLRVIVEGVVFEKRFEADPNVTFIYSWNKRNVYKQKVYGVSSAKVSVGYQYSTCSDVVWVTQTAVLQGYDMDVSEIGGWNLDIHHRYNFQDGVFQKGDGTTVYFTRQPNVVHVVMGNGEQRPLNCDECNGLAKDNKLLAPVALTNGPDGSIYVGDFNLVRRITPKGYVQTLLKLSAIQMSYHYHLAVHPVDGSLYMSNPEKGHIMRVVTEYEHGDTLPLSRVDVAVGSGERCVVGDHHLCGDGRSAREAKLAYPKGMTISSDGVLYFADGINIRMVDKTGIVHTLIGSHHHHRKHRKPLPCSGAIPAREVQLLWPTEVTHSPLDGALYFIDDNLILKLTQDQQVLVVVGRPMHCPEVVQPTGDIRYAKGATFGSILGLTFVPNGKLLFAEVTAKKVNLIHEVTPDGRLERFAGSLQHCDCSLANCSCADHKYSLAVNTQLFAISALTVTHDGVVYVADHGSLRILAMLPYLPKPNQLGDYEIVFPDMQEVYVFNRYGQHTVTRNILTGKTVYAFLYSVNTSFGKLSTVTDASGNKVAFLRDYSGKVNTIENAQGQKYNIKISKIGLMEGLVTFSNFEMVFEYHGSSGLLSSRTDSAGNTYVYQYDDNGRLQEAVTPTGQSVSMSIGMCPNGATVTITKGSDDPYSLTLVETSSIITKEGMGSKELKTYPNGTATLRAEWGYNSEVRTAPHAALDVTNPIQAEMFYTPVGWTATSGHLSSTVEWKYGIMGDARSQEKLVERQLWVNNVSVLTVEYDQTMLREVFYDRDRYSVFAVQYDSAGKPVQWVPSIGGLPVNIMYDRFGRLFNWQWGNMGEEFSYDRQGLLTEIKYEDGTSFSYSYAENSLPLKFILPSKREFSMHYDHHGNLQYIVTPGGGEHHFSVQLSMGFTKLLYTPPGFSSPLVQNYDENGLLTLVVHPNGAGRIMYRYENSSRLSAVVYGNSEILYRYNDDSGLLVQVHHGGAGDFEYWKDYQYNGVLISEERHTFGSQTGLSNAKFVYDYDDNFRLVNFRGRIGGQDVPSTNYSYDSRSGLPQRIGHFNLTSPRPNETSIYDEVAVMNRSRDMYFRDVLVTLTIDKTEVFKLEVDYDKRNRIFSIHTHLRKIGSSLANTDTKNYTYDDDGQLVEVQTHDKWRFEYDLNGNMISMNFKGHVIPLQYNLMDRIVKYGEMAFKVDERGFITQRGEEHFYYNAKGHMVRATQAGRYDVRYSYDERDRLVVRKDHFGNVTQFFYVNPESPFQVTHIYSPRDGRTMNLLYDGQSHLIYAQVGAQRYYIGTDMSGSPVVLFSKFGELVREMARSAYGHIVYDSNPFIYMPIDYQGGVLDSVTGLLHLKDHVYDPLFGHFMTPLWSDVFSHISVPHTFHLFRINGNDPINPVTNRWFLTDHLQWLRQLGYNAHSLVPHLNTKIQQNCPPPIEKKPAVPVQESIQAVSGVGCIVRVRESTLLQLTTVPLIMVKKDPVLHQWVPRLHAASAPLGRGIIVSRVDRRAIVRAASSDSNLIMRDVMTSVLNQSFFLDIRMTHQRHDTFFFIKENVWQVAGDWNQLQRLGSTVNYTMHKPSDPDLVAMDKERQPVDIKIHTPGGSLNVRYGTTYDKERQRVLQHAKNHAITHAWALEQRLIRSGYSGSRDWSPAEVEQILQTGIVVGYHGNYIHSVETYPELADDPLNIAFSRESGSSGRHPR